MPAPTTIDALARARHERQALVDDAEVVVLDHDVVSVSAEVGAPDVRLLAQRVRRVARDDRPSSST